MSAAVEKHNQRGYVLVVDDSDDIRWAVAEVLREEGYEVAEATHGRQALDVLRLRKPRGPALIVLDLMMPEMDGFQFRAEQLQDPQLACIPVLILSAHADLQARTETLRAAAVLVKPTELTTLLATVRAIIG